ncbi:MAG: hypothetical protein WBE78_02285, partial [Candidatus Binataceae bacterium]
RAAADGPKIAYRKSCKKEPITAKSAAFSRSLFFEPLKKIPNEPTEIALNSRNSRHHLARIVSK